MNISDDSPGVIPVDISSKRRATLRAVQLAVPCVFTAGLFLVLVAFVETIKRASIPLGLFGVVLPSGVWVLIWKQYKPSIQTNAFGPCFLNTTLVLTFATYVFKLRAETPAYLDISLLASSAACAYFFHLAVWSNPGRLPLGQPPPGGYKILTQSEWDAVNNTAAAQEEELGLPFVPPQGDAEQGCVPLPQHHLRQLAERGEAANEDVEKQLLPLPLPLSSPPKLLPLNPMAGHEFSSPDKHTGLQRSKQLTSDEPHDNEQGSSDQQERPIWHASAYCYECHIWRWPRSKHCWKCARCTERFDHHCPAIGTCVGRRNHAKFMAVLLTFIVAEVLFCRCSFRWLRAHGMMAVTPGHRLNFGYGNPLGNAELGLLGLSQALTQEPWLVIIAVFMWVQRIWQVPLLLFHVYCAAINLTTNECANWRRNPNLHVELPAKPGQRFPRLKFVNPYNRGILRNLKDLIFHKDHGSL